MAGTPPLVVRGDSTLKSIAAHILRGAGRIFALTDKERLQSVLEFSLCVAEEVVADAAAAALAAADESNET